MRDLRIINKTEKVNSLLSSYNIDFLDIVESSISTSINSRKVSGKHGTNKSGLEVGDTSISIILRFEAHSTSEYITKERKLKELFSHDNELTIAPMFSNDNIYDFVKIGQAQPTKSKPKEVYYYDVYLDDDFTINRNGHRADVTINLITSQSPYRYVNERVIDLSRPTSSSGSSFTYIFDNNGNIPQNSRSFYINVEIRGINVSRDMTITSNGIYKLTNTVVPTEKFVFNGYSSRLNNRNVTNKTNYGTIDIGVGRNTIVIKSISGTISGTPTGEIRFKEYIR